MGRVGGCECCCCSVTRFGEIELLLCHFGNFCRDISILPSLLSFLAIFVLLGKS